MRTELPAELSGGIEALLHGVSQSDVARRSAAISRLYRASRTSHQTIAGPADAAAYSVSRLPATYAAVCAALDAARSRLPDFAPGSLLDIGAGPGTASWAALEIWPALAQISMVDSNRSDRRAGFSRRPMSRKPP